MIVDAFMLRDELDLLEARLVEYFDVVDRFVIVEGELQFGDGQPKPLWFAEHRERFDQFADKIVHVVVGADEFPTGDGWGRERHQRNRIAAGLHDLDGSDVVMLGDVDEFPSWEQVAERRLGGSLMRHYVYAPNLEHPQMWSGTVILRAGEISTPQQVREQRSDHRLTLSGHHFSWHPGAEPLVTKVRASSHVEFAGCDPTMSKVDRVTHWDRTPLAVVEMDETWPLWFHTMMPDEWLA